MARLNELPAPAESHLEILRRKFLRQNRDIAKINSDQSQKIRRLENDCARLLSENLELRGHILRLEKQVEDNSARRIADHALEVKARLEAQLSEFAALLGNLGAEPPAKRRASSDRIFAKPRPSLIRSPPQRKRRDAGLDAEALAEQEGRLPPIYENKQYQRATMNSEEILALCAAAADTSDSPDLGPPPVSRYVDDATVIPDSPARVHEPRSPQPPSIPSSPALFQDDSVVAGSPEPRRSDLPQTMATQASPSRVPVSIGKPAAPEPAVQPIRAGAKRKYGDENELNLTAMTHTGKENATAPEKLLPSRGAQKRRSIKELPGGRREKGSTRTPLAAKSTNKDLSSPRKTLKAAQLKEAKKKPAQAPKRSAVKVEAIEQKPLPEVEIALSEPPAVIEVMLESETGLPLNIPTSPATPDRAAQDLPHDTPPPADISSTGETSRPSRRARAAISYAEPNLRDKMRRPTKQLFDAVAGEGKFAHRASIAKPDDHHPVPTSSSKVRTEPGSATSRSSKTSSLAHQQSEAQRHNLLSPLAQKDAFAEGLPSTVVTERRKRPSAVGNSRESLAALVMMDDLTAAQTSPIKNAESTTGGAAATGRGTDHDRQAHVPPEVDVYDFSASSPSSFSTTKAPPDTTITTKPTAAHTNPSNPARSRTARKSSMAAAAALRSLLDEEEQEDANKAPPPSHKPRPSAAHARKRASMLAPKKSSMLLEIAEAEAAAGEEVANSSGLSAASSEGGGGGGGRDRISRRRSMML